MSGLYIHIPFCQSRCRYCDFYSTTLLQHRAEYTLALIEEIRGRFEEAPRTIYLGGGTPSMLSEAQIADILRAVPGMEQAEEITIEANPGDLSIGYLSALRRLGVNRLSIGIQSLQDPLLRAIGRRHTAQQAIRAVEAAQEAGFTNISVDLMYGLPGQTMEQWKDDIRMVLQLGIQHISTYCLSYEQGTVLTQMRDRGEIAEQDEDTLNEMYDYLCQVLHDHGFEHYEVSNFARPGFRSRHNSSYWCGIPYTGVGAGAHSYDGKTRSWNANDLEQYIHASLAHNLIQQSETLSDEERHEEAIMLGMRTREGIPMALLSTQAQKKADAHIARNLLTYNEERTHIHATQEGLHILNSIICDLI